MRRVRGVPLAYVVRQRNKVAHISPGCYAYLNFDEEMIARTPLVSKIKPQEDLKVPRQNICQLAMWYIQDWQCLGVSYSLKDFHRHVKQRKVMQDGQVIFSNIHKPFFGPDHMARQVTKAKRKFKNSMIEENMGLGQVSHTPQWIAHYKGQPFWSCL